MIEKNRDQEKIKRMITKWNKDVDMLKAKIRGTEKPGDKKTRIETGSEKSRSS